jgi:radical SAM PhpK family P-methyltransferase
MSLMPGTDCLIIGYNDYPLEALAAKARPARGRSGDYAEIARNSYLVGGRRIDFCGLLNAEAKRVLGIDPAFNAFELPSLGAHYLANFLSGRGFSTEVINLFNNEKGRLDELLAAGPRAVAVTTTYYVTPEPVQEVVGYVRDRCPSAVVVLGGPFVFHLAEDLTPAELDIMFRRLGADVLVHDSQGEATLARVVAALRDGGDLSVIPNLVYRDGGRLVRTTRAVESNPLAENAVDWSRFPRDRVTPVTFVRTSRSCPFSCAFCSYPAMGGKYQVAAVEPVLRELRQLRDMGTQYVVFTDDTFNVPPTRFKALLRGMIADKLDLRWVSFFRCSHADAECFELMEQSGCMAAYLGIESGDEGVLKAMNKYATADQYRAGLRQLHDHGILSFGSFITGHPGETRASVSNTVDFIEETAPTFFNVQMFFLDPTAPINAQREAFGLTGAQYRWKHRTMGWEEASALTDYTLRAVTKSIQLPLYGFSIWSVPYLLTRGFSLADVVAFASAAQRVMLRGLGDEEGDYGPERAAIEQVLRGWDARRGGSREVLP